MSYRPVGQLVCYHDVYLNFASSRFVLNVIEAVRAIANSVLLHILLRVRPTLGRDARHVLHGAQVYDQLLVEVVLRGRPRVQTF